MDSKKEIIRYQRISANNKKLFTRQSRNPYLIGKRIFDILVSILFIVLVLSWIIPILAILIKLDSQGPVFFIQDRVGFLGQTFRCYKLRTMIVNSERDSRQALENDPRTTRVGHFLRLTNLDEIPQFVNVLIGNMSVVGPRPLMKKDDQMFSNAVSNYALRYNAMPGITGMAQIMGYRGRTNNSNSIFHRYHWDAFYIRNACTELDFKIIFITARQTVKNIFLFNNARHKNSFEEAEGQISKT
jgi:putative colanic acid biosysnthesis UDP-glucose lipid carrier transferase